MSKDKSTTKTDAMRVQRELLAKQREEAAAQRAMVEKKGRVKREPEAATDVRVNEATVEDPNGRGGKTKIKVPSTTEPDGGPKKAKARRDEFPAPPVAGVTFAAEGRCTGCKKIRALRNGLVISHSWPPPTRQVCLGAGKPPLGHHS